MIERGHHELVIIQTLLILAGTKDISLAAGQIPEHICNLMNGNLLTNPITIQTNSSYSKIQGLCT